MSLFGALFEAFPDLRAEIHDQVEEADKVVTRKTFHGTHEGEFMGIPARGRSVAWEVIDIVRVIDNKMVEHWNVVDALSPMQQLGAIPAPTA
jgi:predicted ester cyclase